MSDASDAPPPREFRVRPYTLTGGRTRSDEGLGIESLVQKGRGHQGESVPN